MLNMKKTAAAVAFLVGAGASAQALASWFPYKAEATEPAFAIDGAHKAIDYTPLSKASKKWNICVSFPHMKDAYWLGVDYGVADEAKRLGVEMQLVEAGGYTNLNKQISQIEDCVTRGAQAVVIGAISGDGLNNLLKTLAPKNIPVIDLVNGISSKDISAKSLVSFYTMGHATGEYLAKKHPSGDKPVKVGWFPGPAGAAWVEAAHKGFMDAIKGSAVVALEPKFGDTGKEVQAKMIEDVLQANPDVSYIAGTAVTAEAGVGIIRSRNLDKKVSLLSFYMTPGVYEGIRNGRIMSAPADSMVVQGRIAIDQAVRLLEGKDVVKHVGPKIFVVDQSNIGKVNKDDILPPTDFKAVFNVK
jgi:protein TorT